jgi:hypothetical protein
MLRLVWACQAAGRGGPWAAAAAAAALHGAPPLGAPAAPAQGLREHGAPRHQHQVQHQQQRGLHLAPPFLVEDYVPVSVTTHRLGWTRVRRHRRGPHKPCAASVRAACLANRSSRTSSQPLAPHAQAKVERALQELKECRACPRWGEGGARARGKAR